MNLPSLKIKFQNQFSSIPRYKEEAKNHKFQIGQELDLIFDLVTNGDKILNNYGTTKVKIKDSK